MGSKLFPCDCDIHRARLLTLTASLPHLPSRSSPLSHSAVLQALDADGKIMLDGGEFYITH
jgi:hypothetical protein